MAVSRVLPQLYRQSMRLAGKLETFGTSISDSRPGGGLWGGQNEKKTVSMRIFFEGLIGKIGGARQCDGRGTPDIR